MSSRHKRRREAAKRWEAKATALVEAHHAWERDKIVKGNLANPHRPERSGSLASHSAKWLTGYGARGANGRALFSTPNSQVKGKR